MIERWGDPEVIERLRFRYRMLRIGVRLWWRNWRARGGG